MTEGDLVVMAIIKVSAEESVASGSLIKELSFNDETAEGKIVLDYYYLMSMVSKLMEKIPEESLQDNDSLGEQMIRNLIVETMQLTTKLAKLSADCDKEEAVEEANNIVTEGDDDDEKWETEE